MDWSNLLSLPEGPLREAVLLLPGICLGHAGALMLPLLPRFPRTLAAAPTLRAAG